MPHQFRLSYTLLHELEAIRHLDAACFPKPWTEEDYRNALDHKLTLGYTAHWDEQIVGCVVYRLMQEEIQIVRILVDPTWRRNKVGTALIEKLKLKCHPNRRHTMLVDVPEENLQAQLFFKDQGFIAQGIDYTPEDTTYLMTWIAL